MSASVPFGLCSLINPIIMKLVDDGAFYLKPQASETRIYVTILFSYLTELLSSADAAKSMSLKPGKSLTSQTASRILLEKNNN